MRDQRIAGLKMVVRWMQAAKLSGALLNTLSHELGPDAHTGCMVKHVSHSHHFSLWGVAWMMQTVGATHALHALEGAAWR